MDCKRVFILGVDGAGDGPGRIETPNFDRILKRGAYSYCAQATLPTVSGECWGSILTGVWPEKNGLTNDAVLSKAYAVDAPYPTLFRLARAAHPDTELASFTSWTPINTGIIESNTACYFRRADDETLTRELVQYVQEHDPMLVFLLLEGCDAAGHEFGYFTEGHLNAVREADRRIGLILDAIEARGMFEDSCILIMADHGGGGGHPRYHGTDTPLDRTVFWGVSAPFVKKGCQISAPVQIADTAAVAAYALGLRLPNAIDGAIPEGILQDA